MELIPDWTALGGPSSGVPTPNFRRITPDNSGRIMEAGMESAASNLGRYSDQDYQAQQKAKLDAVNLARAQGMDAAMGHDIAVKGIAEQIHQDVQSGKLPYDQARQTYNDQVAKIPAPQIANLDPVGQENLQKALQRNVATSGFAIDGAVQVARQNDYKDRLFSIGDKAQKLAGMPGADIQSVNDRLDMMRPLARDAGLAPEMVDKHIEEIKESNWYSSAAQRAMTSKDNPQALQLLQHDLVDADGFYADKLGAHQRNAVLNTVINAQGELERRTELEQTKRETRGQMALRSVDQQIASGVPATPAMWAQWDATTKGTLAEPEFRQAQADEVTVQSVLRQPPDQQQRYIQEQQQKLDTQGGSIRDQENLKRLTDAVKQNTNLMEKAPLQYIAVRSGHDFPPLALQGMDKPEGQQLVGAQIADRMAALAATRKQYGSQVGLLPLQPQEADQIASQLKNSTPKDRMQFLTALHQSFKNDDAYQAAMRQVAPHDPVSAIVGQMLGNSQPQSTPVWFDRYFASPTLQGGTLVLRGSALLNPPQAAGDEQKGAGFKQGFPLPDKSNSGEDLQQYFAQKAGDVFRDRPQLADAHYAIFKAAYAGLLAEQGNMKGIADPTLEQKALDIALGTQAQRTDYNGATVRVPDGMDPLRFKEAVQGAIASTIKGTGANAAWTDHALGYQLEELGGLGSGQYHLMNGTLTVTMPRARSAPVPESPRPFIIDLRKQYLPGAVKGAPWGKASMPGLERAMSEGLQTSMEAGGG